MLNSHTVQATLLQEDLVIIMLSSFNTPLSTEKKFSREKIAQILRFGAKNMKFDSMSFPQEERNAITIYWNIVRAQQTSKNEFYCNEMEGFI